MSATDSGKILWKSAAYKGIWQTGKLSPQYVDAHITLGKEGLIFIDQQSIVILYDLEKDPWQMNDLTNDPKVTDEKKRLADKLRKVGLESGDPRVTGEMHLFRKTRQYVQKRKRMGYRKSGSLPFDEANTH